MSQTPKLLPCPFCGGEPDVVGVYEYGGHTYGIECACFGESGPAFDFSASESEATASWNRRAESALAARHEALRTLVERMCRFHEQVVVTSITEEAYTDIMREAFAAVDREYPEQVEQAAKRNIEANAARDRAALEADK